jgi:hypothetical protein
MLTETHDAPLPTIKNRPRQSLEDILREEREQMALCLDLNGFPPEREGFTALVDACHQICEGVADFQVYTPMPRRLARAVFAKINKGILSKGLCIGSFSEEGVFTPLSLWAWRRAYRLKFRWDVNHPSGLFAELYIQDEKITGGFASVARRVSF